MTVVSMTQRLLASPGLTAWTAGTALAIAVGGDIAPTAPPIALINESPSLPRGVYVRVWRAQPEPGAIVALTPPSQARPYLGQLGLPTDVRLLKRVAAAEGDLVCAEGDRIRLPGRVVAVRSQDRQGMSLSAWSDCRRLKADERFLLGDTANSFDSRYFGPVSAADIEGVFRPVLTW